MYINRQGNVIIEFDPIKEITKENKVNYDYEKQKRYYLTIKEIGKILSIKEIPDNFISSIIQEYIELEYKDTKSITIERVKEKERLAFTYRESPNIEIGVNVRFSELRIMQELIEVIF